MRLQIKKRFRGFTLIEVMTVAAIVTSMESNSYQGVMDKTKALKCQNNLRQIGLVLMTMGELPDADFYPEGDPKTDPKSLVVLTKDSLPEEIFVCPTSPRALADRGLTYLWNDRLNGRNMIGAGKTWVMIEMNCVTENPVAPHSGKYNVLFTDGTVKELATPPKEILEALAEAKKQGMKKKASAANQPETLEKIEVPKYEAPAPKVKNVVVKPDKAQVYRDNQVVATVARGQELEVVEVQGDWVGIKVNINGKWDSGWIKKSDVSE